VTRGSYAAVVGASGSCGRVARGGRRVVRAASLLAIAAASLASTVQAQTFRGRVLDEADDQPVPTALVRLVAEDGEQLAVAIADSSGAYRLRAPRPGTYRLEAARIGYEDFQTPLLEAASATGVYPVDLVVRAEPLPLSGLTVETRVTDREADRQIRRMIGITPASMRYRPIRLPEIQSHVDRAHSLTDLMRWTSNAGVEVRNTTEGPCYRVHRSGCLPVFLNGLPLERDFLDGVPLDMLYTIVIVSPTDVSMAYPGGAVLLYTEAWLR